MKIPLRPKKLRERMDEFSIALPPFAPMWDRVFVCPLKGKKNIVQAGVASSQHTTAGGIIVPAEVGETYEAQVGVIVGMGPKAFEQLYSVGVELGDMVVTNRLSRWEKRYFGVDRSEHVVQIVTAAEITGCVDLNLSLASGECWYEMDEQGKVLFATGDGPRQEQETPAVEYGV